MGSKQSKHRRHRHHYNRHGTNINMSGGSTTTATGTTLEQDAFIGGTGGAMIGLASGVGYMFVNALGLRNSFAIMGFAVVGGTIVGAIVCVAGALMVKSLAWLYRQLRKRTRQGMEVQLSVMTGGPSVGTTQARAAAAAAVAAQGQVQAQGGGGGGDSGSMMDEASLALQQAALAEARQERARALEDLRKYDELLAEAEARLRQALPAGAAAEGGGGGAAALAAAPPAAVPVAVHRVEGEGEGGEGGEGSSSSSSSDDASYSSAASSSSSALSSRVIPPREFFHQQPLHITLRLREVESGEDSDERTTEDDSSSYFLVEAGGIVDGDEEGDVEAPSAAGGTRRPVTPPIY